MTLVPAPSRWDCLCSSLCCLAEGSTLALHPRKCKDCRFALVKRVAPSADRSLLYVSFEFLAAASGPVVTMKGSLHQGSHNTPHCCLIPTSVPLPIVLHSQPVTKNWHQSPGSFRSSTGKTTVKKTVSHAHVSCKMKLFFAFYRYNLHFKLIFFDAKT